MWPSRYYPPRYFAPRYFGEGGDVVANLRFSADLIDDILFRSGEKIDGTSNFEAQALVYLNRAYRSIYMGGTEFDPEFNEKFWWIRAESTLTLEAAIKTGTASVTKNSTTVTLSSAPANSVAGWHFKVDTHHDFFRVSTHSGGSTTVSLDSVYTGDTNSAIAYRLMKFDYDLATDSIKVIDPMMVWADDGDHKVELVSPVDVRRFWADHNTLSGAPEKFCMLDDDTVRFSQYGSDDGKLIRVDYSYLKRPADLVNSGSDEPLVPRQYRHILSDMSLFFLFSDKNDTRVEGVGLMAKSGMRAMSLENRKRFSHAGDLGKIDPRSSVPGLRTLRSTTGKLIGVIK